MDRTQVNIQSASHSLACIKEELSNPDAFCTKLKVDCLSDKEMTNYFAIIELLPKSLTGFIRLFEYNIFSEKRHLKNA